MDKSTPASTTNGQLASLATLSPDLVAELTQLRETAQRLSAEMSSPAAKARLAVALRDLDMIPFLFGTESATRKALVVPAAWIREVADIRSRLGGDAPYFPNR